ncbi:hypothetical protein [Neobacillus cucumis]|uniref:hypothetical protein n=1 Tax=Neobacillus cucumis TaxID=1740721 RepID=UPI001965B8AB|nr:hypothetical protein [Neobacillus cucumis]MBM7653853.1 hypothetical protein [Neobacillus cucumis]
MWVITAFSDKNGTKMYEFDTENEARAAFKNIQGYKILTELIDLEPAFSLVMI